ncbi:MAG: DUF4293 domain-containing protein [Flavobacteriales bacterium]|nr:DUF4293 domain-containing protein [Flavobacteriales bacterium]
MLQRVQTLFLLGAGACAGLTWFFPVRSWALGDSEVRFMTFGLFTGEGVEVVDIGLPLPYHLVHTLLAVAFIVSMFLHRNRPRQARVVRGIWLMALLIGVMQFISCNSIDAYYAEGVKAQASYGASFFLPMGSLLLAILAERAIRKDEELVRSADRLR